MANVSVQAEKHVFGRVSQHVKLPELLLSLGLQDGSGSVI